MVKKLSCEKVRGTKVCFRKVPSINNGSVVIATFKAKGRGNIELQGNTKASALKKVRKYDFI